MPGIMAAIVGMFAALMASESQYGYRWDNIVKNISNKLLRSHFHINFNVTLYCDTFQYYAFVFV